MASPLAGIRVLSYTSSTAGQVAGMLFADLGADVVRIVADRAADEQATGTPGWLCWNRGVRVSEGSLSDVRPALGRADVLLTDLRPSEMAANGLEADSLAVRYPSLVSVWLAATGPVGRWAELPHDHLLLDAIGGFAAHHPATAEVPVAAVVPTRHLVQGQLAVVAALAGLHARLADGWGRSATVSGLHAEASTLNTLVARTLEGPPMVSPGKFLPGSPNFRLYQASDQRWLYMAALSPELFIKALEVLDRLDILAHPDVAGDFLNVLRPEVGVTVGAELDAAFVTATAEEWLARFTAAGVPAALVSDPADWLEGPVIANACPPVKRRHPERGEVTLPSAPLRFELDAITPGELDVAFTDPLRALWAESPPHIEPMGPRPGADDQPLAGLRVLDLATFLAGPFVSTLLAAHGADVVKVESPSGDPYAVFSAPYGNVNQHKPRVALDLRDAADRRRLMDLVGLADVCVDNLLASSLARLDLEPHRFELANPGLVRCSVTAYGAEGPYAELPGFDPIMQSLSGLVAIQGGAGRPIATAAPVHDVATGCAGAIGTLAALWMKRRGGRGQRVFTSLAATSTFLQSAELTSYPGRPDRAVGGPDFIGPDPLQRFYRASDRWIAISAVTDRQRADALVVLGTDDADAIATRLASDGSDVWVERLAAAGVPVCAAINRVELDDPFLVANGYSHELETPVGRLEVVSGYTDWAHQTMRRGPLPLDTLSTDAEAVAARWS